MTSVLLKVMKAIILSRFGIKTPLRVLFFPTFRCNLSCQYCGIWKTHSEEMTTEQIKKAMSDFKNMGTLFWTFTGGEPTLRKDIGELVTYASNLFPIVTLTTNGFFLKHKIEELMDVNYFTISLDGPKEVTNSTRGKGTFEKTLEGIKVAKDAGKEVVINAVLSKANIINNFKGLKELFQIAIENECKLDFNPVYTDQFNKNRISGIEGNPTITSTIYPTDEERISTLNFIKKFKSEHPNLIMLTDGAIEKFKTLGKCENCFSGKLYCDLYPDGTVIPNIFKEKLGVNGLKEGFSRAFQMLPSTNGCSCNSACYTELNLLFNLNLGSIRENLSKYFTFSS